ncbi:MAG TPA: DUF2332 domain-containing protein [Croceibacterium sp.]|nr:DUF2332 domain-containing protein [Croceibacterium sp.]
MAQPPVMGITDVREAIAWQANHADSADAPITGRVVRAELAILDTPTELGRRMARWPGLSLEDAMPLRVAGGLHWLHLSGAESRLTPVYAGEVTDQAAIDAIVAAVARAWDARLVPWLDHPPQTNEAGRSSSVMAGLLWLSRRLGPKFELNEIGASAGVNTMIERYRYDLGGVAVGPADSPMQLRPAWRGPSPPASAVEIVAIRGCDVAPIDLSDPAEALRLKAYVWVDAPERMTRIDAAARLAAERPPLLERRDAGDFVEERLASAQEAGVTRVLYHSIMWQYLPETTRSSITAAMERAGAHATRERPLAWIRLETNRETFRHELSVRYWPGGEEAALLSEAHPHGAWIDWRGVD